MTARVKSLICIAFAAVLCVLFSGCSYVGAEDLYSLPQVSENYIQLQKAIDKLIDQGAEYSSPVSGSFRQAVQTRDIDGDGDQEVLAFMSGSGDNPLKLYIFKQKGDEYEIVGTIEGSGTAFDSLTYADIDGDGKNEMLLGFRMGDSLQMVNAYSVRELNPTLLFAANYSKLICGDITNDGRSDLMVLRLSTADSSGEAELFTIGIDGEVIRSTAPISQGVTSVSKLTIGRLTDDAAALFADFACADGTLTDIFTFDGSLKNITSDGALTSRKSNILCRDINGDGIIEVPQLRTASSSLTSTTVIDWYKFTENGKSSSILSTYHNSTDGWYLEIPSSWKNTILITRQDKESGERTIVFSYRSKEGQMPVDFLKIYTLSGENREDRAYIDGRFILKNMGDTLYAASLTDDFTGIPFSVTAEDVTAAFHIIYSDWQS